MPSTFLDQDLYRDQGLERRAVGTSRLAQREAQRPRSPLAPPRARRPAPGARRSASSPPHPQSHGTSHDGRGVVPGEEDEHGVVLLGQPDEAGRDRAGEGRGAVEHDQAEGAAAQQHVGAPRAAFRVRRAHHGEASGVAERGPIARREGARAVHVRHPAPGRQRAGRELPHQRGTPAAACSHDLGEAPAREATVREGLVERGEARGDRRYPGARRRDERGQLLAESGGDGHGSAGERAGAEEGKGILPLRRSDWSGGRDYTE